MNEMIGELNPPSRIMLTPGPSCIDPRVYRAMAAPLVGHVDPWFTEMMGDVQILLRSVFQTQNRITFPISASGSGGIEAAVVNSLETDDECIICVNGAFSERMAIMAERLSAKVTRVEAPYGRAVDPEDVLQSAFRSFFRRHASGEFALQDWDGMWALLAVITLRKCGHQAEHYLAMCRDINREQTPIVTEESRAHWEAIAREPTPTEAVMLAETVQLLLDGLDPEDRTVVSLRLQDFSAEEISAELGRPLRSVYRALERARKRLQRLHGDDAATP